METQVFDKTHGLETYILVPETKLASGIIQEVWIDNVYHIHPDYISGRPVIDIGANYGAFSVWCAEAGASRVLSFEPFAINLQTLRLNAERYHPVIEVNDAAVMGNEGFVEIFSNDDPASIIVTASAESGLRSVSLNSILEDLEDIAFLKLDVEGSEYDIFDTVDLELLKKVERISMEFHGRSMCSFVDAGQFGSLIEKLGEWGSLEILGHPSIGGYVYGIRY